MSDTYVRKQQPPCEARQWNPASTNQDEWPLNLVRWIESHGGEARYEPEDIRYGGMHVGDHNARIVLTTSTGPQCLYPGWYAVAVDGEPFMHYPRGDYDDLPIPLHEFLPVDPQKFEAEWEPKVE